MKIKLYNGMTVNAKEKSSQGDDFYLLYENLTDEPIDICRGCKLLCKRQLLTGGIDDWLCPLCLIDNREREETK